MVSEKDIVRPDTELAHFGKQKGKAPLENPSQIYKP
jgi:hypothetical protein